MTRDRRSPSSTPTSFKVLTVLVSVGGLFVVLAVASTLGDIFIDTKVNGPPTTAFGFFGNNGPEFEVCSPVMLGTFTPGTELLLENGRTSFASPGGEMDDGVTGYCLREFGRDGGPGVEIFQDEIVIGQTVPAFPNTISVPFDTPPDIPIVAGPGQTQVFFCVKTTQRTAHIPAWLRNGAKIFFRQGDGAFQEAEDNELAYQLEFMISGVGPTPTPPPPTPTGVPDVEIRYLQQGGAGAGSSSDFDTEISAYSDVLVDLQVRMTKRGDDQWESLYDEVVIDHSMVSTNMAGSVFHTYGSNGGFGMVELTGVPGTKTTTSHSTVSPLAQAVIFATLPDGRQFGQFFAAQPAENAQQAGEESLLFTTHDPSRYRVNIGISAVVDGTRVSVTPLGNGGTPLADTVVFELDEGQSDQVNDIHTRWGLGMTADVMVKVVVDAGAAFPYASVLDGRDGVPGTSDPTTILPITGGSQRVVLLEMGRITGLNEFSGSASIYNHTRMPATVRADFYERGVPGVAETASFSLGSMAVRSWDDVVGELTGRTGVVGAVVFSKQGGGPPGQFSAIGREFAIYTENSQVTGTAGQAMPGLANADRLLPGEVFHFIGLRDRPTPQGRERSHLGVLNLETGVVTMTVTSFAADGTMEGSIQQSVQPGEQLRINNILSAINPGQDGEFKRIEVEVSGPLYVLAYRVNGNGDPVTLQAFRVE